MSKKDDGEGGGGFMDKVKDFFEDVGDAVGDAVSFGKPTADIAAIHLPSIGLHAAELIFDVVINNPNPVPIPLVDINYLLESDGRKLASGLIPDAGTLHAHGSETIKIPLKLDFEDMKKTYADINEGSIVPYRARVELIADVPVIGNLTLPLEKRGEIPIPYRPEVDLTKFELEEVSFEETTAVLHVRVGNKNDFEIGIKAVEYEIWLGDDRIGDGKMRKEAKIGKKSEGNVEMPIRFRPKDLGSAVWDVIRGRGMGYKLKGSVELDSVFGPMKLPFCREGGRTKIKKAGDKDDDDDDDF